MGNIKRIAKNTGFLYAKTAITMFMSLYTTRLVLNALGVADFGLFNLVAGAITMLGFFSGSLCIATQRFINYAEGSGDQAKVKQVFAVSMLLHGCMSLLLVLILETAGFLFFHTVFNIEPGKVAAAKIIYQLVIVSTLFTVLAVPYDAVINAHEHMLLFAIAGLLESLLKLGIALVLTYTAGDKLVEYGLLMALIPVILMLLRAIYCHKTYEECTLDIRQNYNRTLMMEITRFGSINLLGTTTSMLAVYGQGIVLNIFFGTTVNAAQGIANQISGQLSVFANTMLRALNPSIDKNEGGGFRALMVKTALLGSKISFFLLALPFIPVLLQMPFIFSVWLKTVPPFTIIFCRLLLLQNLVDALYMPLISAINAVGKIKGFYLAYSAINLLPLAGSLLLFQLHFPPYSMYLVYILYSIVVLITVLFFANRVFHLPAKTFLYGVLLRCLLPFAGACSAAYLVCLLLKEGWLQLACCTLVSSGMLAAMVWLAGLTKEEKQPILLFCKQAAGNIKLRLYPVGKQL